MLPRAKIVSPETTVQSFDWANLSRPPASDMLAAFDAPPRPGADVVPLPAPTPSGVAATGDVEAAVGPEPISADQQAHLAALEREAFTKGYAQGERAGLEAGGKRAEAMLRRVAQTIEELGGFRQTLIKQTERQMVQLALTIARRVVHREVSVDPELAAALVHVALDKLGTTAPATIRLNPEDYTIVAQDGNRWGSTVVTVVPDPSISRGGCLVESDFGCVDATIDRQFDELSRALLGDH